MHITTQRPVLVTGASGFIGFHLALKLLREGHRVVGLDSMNAYYDPALKEQRLQLLQSEGGDCFTFYRNDLTSSALHPIVSEVRPEIVYHLAAQAGVRYSSENPNAYIQANVVGLQNLLNILAEVGGVKHLLFASSSSVYGNRELGDVLQESSSTDSPVSLYAATKKAGEGMTHAFSHLNQVPVTAMRFFTVYGPWGRPDMALFKFTEAALRGAGLPVYGDGESRRDYTFVDDAVEAAIRLGGVPPRSPLRSIPEDSTSTSAPWRVVNVGGGGRHYSVIELTQAIENALGWPVVREYIEAPAGDVSFTYADPTLLRKLTGFVPSTSLTEGVIEFVEWYSRHLDR